jgi:hypothetical protein
MEGGHIEFVVRAGMLILWVSLVLLLIRGSIETAFSLGYGR